MKKAKKSLKTSIDQQRAWACEELIRYIAEFEYSDFENILADQDKLDFSKGSPIASHIYFHMLVARDGMKDAKLFVREMHSLVMANDMNGGIL